MELVIWKNKGSLYTKVYQTYTKGDKKEAVVIKSKSALKHALRLAYYILVNYKWLLTSIETDKSVDTVKPVRRYYSKGNKKK